MVLDGDPVGFERPVEFRFLPDAMRTCVFRTEVQHMDSHSETKTPFPAFGNKGSENSWNNPGTSYVAINKNRMSGRQKEVQPC
jgi:hypothetical protein